MDIKDLFAKHVGYGGELYLPPLKADIVHAGILWKVSLDEDLTDADKLKGLRRFHLMAGLFPFEEALELLLKINARTYNAKVDIGKNEMRAANARKFCERQKEQYRCYPGHITVQSPKNAALSIDRTDKLVSPPYTLTDVVHGNLGQIVEHLRELDFQITAYAFSKKVNEPKH